MESLRSGPTGQGWVLQGCTPLQIAVGRKSRLWSARPAATFISWTDAETAQSSGRYTPWFVRKDITKHSDEKVLGRGTKSLCRDLYMFHRPEA